nr:hypothetical protein Iba_chr11cCG9920 [Ipomoea batatas]
MITKAVIIVGIQLYQNQNNSLFHNMIYCPSSNLLLTSMKPFSLLVKRNCVEKEFL